MVTRKRIHVTIYVQCVSCFCIVLGSVTFHTIKEALTPNWLALWSSRLVQTHSLLPLNGTQCRHNRYVNSPTTSSYVQPCRTSPYVQPCRTSPYIQPWRTSPYIQPCSHSIPIAAPRLYQSALTVIHYILCLLRCLLLALPPEVRKFDKRGFLLSLSTAVEILENRL